MSLRLLLLRPTKTQQEQDIVNTILSSYSSYKAGGRTRPDMALMLARDFMFLNQQNQPPPAPQQMQTQPPMQMQQQPMQWAGQQQTPQQFAPMGAANHSQAQQQNPNNAMFYSSQQQQSAPAPNNGAGNASISMPAPSPHASMSNVLENNSYNATDMLMAHQQNQYHPQLQQQYQQPQQQYQQQQAPPPPPQDIEPNSPMFGELAPSPSYDALATTDGDDPAAGSADGRDHSSSSQ